MRCRKQGSSKAEEWAIPVGSSMARQLHERLHRMQQFSHHSNTVVACSSREPICDEDGCLNEATTFDSERTMFVCDGRHKQEEEDQESGAEVQG